MATKSNATPERERQIIEAWRQTERKFSPGDKPDPVMQRIRRRRQAIRARVGLLSDSLELLREDRNR